MLRNDYWLWYGGKNTDIISLSHLIIIKQFDAICILWSEMIGKNINSFFIGFRKEYAQSEGRASDIWVQVSQRGVYKLMDTCLYIFNSWRNAKELDENKEGILVIRQDCKRSLT